MLTRMARLLTRMARMARMLTRMTRWLAGSRIVHTPSQVAQAQNMSIGEHRQCCITFEI